MRGRDLDTREPVLRPPDSQLALQVPQRHWELDARASRRNKSSSAAAVPSSSRRSPSRRSARRRSDQQEAGFRRGQGLSTQEQQYDPTSIINEVRGHVDSWRALPNPSEWQVTPETARLLQHWRHHDFSGIRPFFCQVEAVETAIWLTEVAPESKRRQAAARPPGQRQHAMPIPELLRLALKLATGAGKTTVMAMLIAWQTINAVRRPASKQFTRGFLIVAPGLTIKDRLRVLQPNDPDSYYASRELVPGDMLDDLNRAKIVITNYHAFKLRERMRAFQGRPPAAAGPMAMKL